MKKLIFLLLGILVLLISLKFVGNSYAELNECEDKTYYTKAVCFYQPNNTLCPIYCEDYYVYCLKGRYILKKKAGEYICLTVEEYLKVFR